MRRSSRASSRRPALVSRYERGTAGTSTGVSERGVARGEALDVADGERDRQHGARREALDRHAAGVALERAQQRPHRAGVERGTEVGRGIGLEPRRSRCPSRRDAPGGAEQRREQVVGLGVLEDPADRAGIDRLARGGRVGEGAQHEDGGLRAAGGQRADEPEGVDARHREVLEDDVRVERAGERERLVGVGHRADELAVRLGLEQHAQPVADGLAVVDDQRPHPGGDGCGRIALAGVPPALVVGPPCHASQGGNDMVEATTRRWSYDRRNVQV